MTVLVNKISGIAHNNLEDALEYYALEEDYDLENKYIGSLEDLCDTLNELDLYGCGSSFEIKEV